LARLPVVSGEEAIKALEHLGFKVYRQTGSHIHLGMKKEDL
jgi:predicted RNA binding protein YcfA (HicA-like mRNA interferase family)